MATHVGIDLGTTNTLAAVKEKDGHVSFVDFDGSEFLPSVYYNDGENECVGTPAVNHGMLNPRYEVRNSKLNMASTFRYNLASKEYSSKDIATIILRHVLNEVKSQFPDQTGEYSATITIPVGFSPVQRRETEQAAFDAGFVDVNTINEPVASILAYGVYEDVVNSNDQELKRRYLICDMGGGTTDLAIVAVEKNYYDIECKSYNNRLGGNDFDRVIERYIYQIINCQKYHYIDFMHNSVSEDINLRNIYKTELAYLKVKRKISEKARGVKEHLSLVNQCLFQIDNLYTDSEYPNGREFELKLTRNEFNNLNGNAELFEGFVFSITTLLAEMKKKGIRTNQLNGIIFAGGGMQMPFLQQILLDHFEGIDRVNGNTSIFRTVALGAALYNQNIEEKRVSSVPVTSGAEKNTFVQNPEEVENLVDDGTEYLQNRSQIENIYNEVIDQKKESRLKQTQKEFEDNNLDITPNTNSPVIIDRLPYNISVRLNNGELLTVLEKGTPYPPKVVKRKQFTTNHDRQKRLLFEIYAGNGRKPRDKSNELIAVQSINITAEKTGYARIGAQFILDEYGRLSIIFKDLEHPDEKSIVREDIQWRM